MVIDGIWLILGNMNMFYDVDMSKVKYFEFLKFKEWKRPCQSISNKDNKSTPKIRNFMHFN